MGLSNPLTIFLSTPEMLGWIQEWDLLNLFYPSCDGLLPIDLFIATSRFIHNYQFGSQIAYQGPMLRNPFSCVLQNPAFTGILWTQFSVFTGKIFLENVSFAPANKGKCEWGKYISHHWLMIIVSNNLVSLKWICNYFFNHCNYYFVITELRFSWHRYQGSQLLSYLTLSWWTSVMEWLLSVLSAESFS